MAAYVYLLGFESEPGSSRDTGGAAKVVEGSAMRDASSCKVLSWETSQSCPPFLNPSLAYVDDVNTITLHSDGR